MNGNPDFAAERNRGTRRGKGKEGENSIIIYAGDVPEIKTPKLRFERGKITEGKELQGNIRAKRAFRVHLRERHLESPE